MSQSNATVKTRRVSVGTLGNKEIELFESQWNLLNDYVENAELQYNCGNKEKALQFTKKALAIMPEYLPAMKLQVRIQKLQVESENKPDVTFIDPGVKDDIDEETCTEESAMETSDTSIETTSHDTLHDSPVYQVPGPFSSTPMPKTVQFSKIASTLGKGILKRSTSVENMRSNSTVFEPPRTRQSSRKYSSDQLIRRKKVFELLSNARSNQMDPRTLYMELAMLWDTEIKSFPCVAASCDFYERNRIDTCHHIIETHLPTDTKPFFCKSCKMGFQNMSDLLGHAHYTHPNARWYSALKEMMAKHPQ